MMALAATYTRPGDPAEVVEVAEVDDPTEVGRGQVLIRVVAFPIHRGDLQAIAGVDPAGRVLRAGVEATGVVDAVAPGVAGLQKGQRVSVFPQPGGWSQWVTADAQFVVPVPDAVSDEVAAQMLVNPITVLMLRRQAEKHFSTGYDGVVINNAAGGSVGRLFTAVCQHHHIATISVVHSAEGADRLQQRFPNVPVVSTDTGGWVNTVQTAAGGHAIPIALDPIGGQIGAGLLNLLTPGGTLVCYGQMATEPMPLHAATLLASGLGLRGLNIFRWTLTVPAEQRASDVASALLMAQGLPDQFDVSAVYGLDELPTAIRHATRAGKIGTVLVRPWK
jgi:NADPH:quinone reductase-like Zn-dependent oxidoreductase